ncbi:MAG: phosphatase PAP2 family protein [candidate division Zixibacteria bacterium]|nr:phosphatase PAP2 family protein [candidate division Zixibacteria bacterium]
MFKELDIAVLHFFNHDLANPFLDFLFVSISESIALKFFLAAMVIAVLWKGNTKARAAIIIAVISIAIVDPSTHYILKKLFARLRPCHVLDDLRMLVGCGGLYGFPSNHAANSFAAATVLSVFYRRFVILFMSIAALIGLSRVYIGKHYLSDVLAGAVWGIAVSICLIYLINKIALSVPENYISNRYKSILQGASNWRISKISSK